MPARISDARGLETLVSGLNASVAEKVDNCNNSDVIIVTQTNISVDKLHICWRKPKLKTCYEKSNSWYNAKVHQIKCQFMAVQFTLSNLKVIMLHVYLSVSLFIYQSVCLAIPSSICQCVCLPGCQITTVIFSQKSFQYLPKS